MTAAMVPAVATAALLVDTILGRLIRALCLVLVESHRRCWTSRTTGHTCGSVLVWSLRRTKDVIAELGVSDETGAGWPRQTSFVAFSGKAVPSTDTPQREDACMMARAV